MAVFQLYTTCGHCRNKFFAQTEASAGEAVDRRIPARYTFNYLVAQVYILYKTFRRRVNFTVLVRVGVDGNGMSFLKLPFKYIFSGFGLLSYYKERGFDVFFRKHVQNFRSNPIAGPVVESQINAFNQAFVIVCLRKRKSSVPYPKPSAYNQHNCKCKHSRTKSGKISVHIRILCIIPYFTSNFKN